MASEHHHPPPFVRLRQWLALEKNDVAAIVVYALAIAFLSLATPVVVQTLVNSVAFAAALQPIVVLSLLLFFALAFVAVLMAVQTFVAEVLQRRLLVRAASAVADGLTHADLGALGKTDVPVLATRFFDVFLLQKSAIALLLSSIETVLTLAVGTLVLAVYHPLFVLVDVIIVGLLVAVVRYGLHRGAETAIDESKAKYHLTGWFQEQAQRVADLKFGAGPQFAWQRADALVEAYLRARADHFAIAFLQQRSVLVIATVLSVAVLLLGGYLIMVGAMTLGQLVAAEILVTAIAGAIGKLGKVLDTAYDVVASIDKLAHITEIPTETTRGDACALPDAPTVVLSCVSTEGATCLLDVDLHIRGGARVCVVGDAGASALLAVMATLRPYRGRLLLGDIDVADAQLDHLRTRIAWVRDAALVSGTVFDNIALGNERITRTRARALLDALAPGFGPDLDDEVGTCGAALSRVDATIITLARAWASEPVLCIVDGALDGLTEARRARVLDLLFSQPQRTTVVVASNEADVCPRADTVFEVTTENGQNRVRQRRGA